MRIMTGPPPKDRRFLAKCEEHGYSIGRWELNGYSWQEVWWNEKNWGGQSPGFAVWCGKESISSTFCPKFTEWAELPQ